MEREIAQHFEDAINATYSGLMLLARDVNLPPQLGERYTSGLVIRERAFTDATVRLGGMVTSHRFVILSNHMVDFDMLLGDQREADAPDWQLHVANRDSRFKVLGQCELEGRIHIFLLHLPDDERWRLLAEVQLDIDEGILADAADRMAGRVSQRPIPEVTSEAWLDRCRFPIGMTEEGELFPLDE
ncbi:MAG: hypothetical protein K2R93_02940 [Gemmatimonadaceae bacterium]|nr:hypothetical protein [Gemmatimonadaceae bacterium]